MAWPVAKNFAHIICAQMAQDSPTKYLDTMSKSQRVGKIFLDYLRNDRTATAVAVMSPRAREGAPVSMPIRWEAVRRGLNPKKFTVRTATEAVAHVQTMDRIRCGGRARSRMPSAQSPASPRHADRAAKRSLEISLSTRLAPA